MGGVSGRESRGWGSGTLMKHTNTYRPAIWRAIASLRCVRRPFTIYDVVCELGERGRIYQETYIKLALQDMRVMGKVHIHTRGSRGQHQLYEASSR